MCRSPDGSPASACLPPPLLILSCRLFSPPLLHSSSLVLPSSPLLSSPPFIGFSSLLVSSALLFVNLLLFIYQSHLIVMSVVQPYRRTQRVT